VQGHAVPLIRVAGARAKAAGIHPLAGMYGALTQRTRPACIGEGPTDEIPEAGVDRRQIPYRMPVAALACGVIAWCHTGSWPLRGEIESE